MTPHKIKNVYDLELLINRKKWKWPFLKWSPRTYHDVDDGLQCYSCWEETRQRHCDRVLQCVFEQKQEDRQKIKNHKRRETFFIQNSWSFLFLLPSPSCVWRWREREKFLFLWLVLNSRNRKETVSEKSLFQEPLCSQGILCLLMKDQSIIERWQDRLPVFSFSQHFTFTLFLWPHNFLELKNHECYS